MKPRSAKSKGKKLQNWVKDQLIKHTPSLVKDIKSTTMGEQGEDIQFSPLARLHWPFQIECKNRGQISVYRDFDQCVSHGENIPVLVIKQDHSVPLVVVDAEWFFKVWHENIERRGG